MKRAGSGADGRQRASATPARIRDRRVWPEGHCYLIHRTKALRPLLARLSGHRTANGVCLSAPFPGTKPVILGNKKGISYGQNVQKNEAPV